MVTSLAVPTPVLFVSVPQVLQTDADVVRIQHSLAAANRAPRRHDRRRAGSLQPAGSDRVVRAVAQDLEAIVNQLAAGLHSRHRVRQKGLAVGQNLQLHPVRAGILQPQQNLATQPRGSHGVIGGKAPRRVWQDREPIEVDEIQNIPPVCIDEAFAAHGHGNHVGTAGLKTGLHLFERVVLASADNQTRLQFVTADTQR